MRIAVVVDTAYSFFDKIENKSYKLTVFKVKGRPVAFVGCYSAGALMRSKGGAIERIAKD